MLRTSRNLVHKRIVTSMAVVPIPRPSVRPSASLSEKGIAVFENIVGDEVFVMRSNVWKLRLSPM